MPFTTLIDTPSLADRLGDPAVAIVDCRFALDDETWGEREYLARHIPGAVFAHLGHDLAGQKTGRNGRHPLPEPAVLAKTFGRLGIGDGVQVIAYDQDNGSFASRLWWMSRYMGHDAVAVLDGGFAKWIAEGRPTEPGASARVAREFRADMRANMMRTAGEVTQLIGRSDWRLLDARAPERYSGDVEPIDKVAGHIPSAVNHPFKSNLSASGTFKTPAELRTQFEVSLADVAPDHAVCYCGSGVTACHNLLALEHAGLHGAKLYAGSWSEWSADPSREIAKGAGG
jgi:thiosulfate/3-mercaptopyruvate sulfurtransferase